MNNQATEQNIRSNQNKRRSAGLAIALAVFIILFLLTTAVLGSRLYNLVTRDQYTVDLGVNEPIGELELFRIEYSNADGNITVKGVDGANVVAPGTVAGYDIRLRNNEDVALDFVMSPSVSFLTGEVIPVEFKMTDSFGNYILGSDSYWVSAATVNTLEHKSSIHPGEVYTYHITWRWVFEVSDAQNAYDTALGTTDGAAVPGISVGVVTEAVANPYLTTKDITHVTHLQRESFGCCWCCWLVWVLLMACILLMLWLWLLHKKLNSYEQTMEEYENLLIANGLMPAASRERNVHAE